MFAIDSTMLLLFLSRNTSPPIDPTTGEPVLDAKERVDYLIEKAQKSRAKIVIPTPVLSEVLVRAGSARNEYLRILQQSAFFRIMPFDTRAAVDVADMTRTAMDEGDKKGGSSSPWAKVKFDRQIVAIAKNEQVSAIYSDDSDIRNIAARFSIPVIGLCDMEAPPTTIQGVLPLGQAASSSGSLPQNAEQFEPQEDEHLGSWSNDTENEAK